MIALWLIINHWLVFSSKLPCCQTCPPQSSHIITRSCINFSTFCLGDNLFCPATEWCESHSAPRASPRPRLKLTSLTPQLGKSPGLTDRPPLRGWPMASTDLMGTELRTGPAANVGPPQAWAWSCGKMPSLCEKMDF